LNLDDWAVISPPQKRSFNRYPWRASALASLA
jgi:hypothetical protein